MAKLIMKVCIHPLFSPIFLKHRFCDFCNVEFVKVRTIGAFPYSYLLIVIDVDDA
jgi:hypothetical protein